MELGIFKYQRISMQKLWIISVCSFFFYHYLRSEIGPEGFINFPHEYFVETGSYEGDGIERALHDQFKYVISIENDRRQYYRLKKKFSLFPHVKIWCGDSGVFLGKMIAHIDKPITFWLDAHRYPPIKNTKNCPLLEELEHIKHHHIKNHTILIDDIRCSGTADFDFISQNDLRKKILEINPYYTIYYINGGVNGERENDILVAEILC